MKKDHPEKKHIHKKGKRAAVVLIILATWLLASFVWMEHYFADLTMDKLIFQMRVPMTGTNSDIVWNYFLYTVPPCVLVGVLLRFLLQGRRRGKETIMQEAEITGPETKHFVQGTASAGQQTEGVFEKTSRMERFLTGLRRHLTAVSVIYLAGTIAFGVLRYQIPTYLYDQTHPSRLYENYYVDPDVVELTFPKEKQNLIYIFLESFENTYASKEYGGFQEENLLPNLTALQEEEDSVYFSQRGGFGMVEMANCSWTMASMVAQTSGVPLSIPLANNDYDMYDTFLPGLVTLGEILDKEGYHQVLLLGSDAAFAGTNHYFQQHGNYVIHDYVYAKENGWISEDYYEWWGFEDQKLFSFAKEEATRLAKEGEPFNLTFATMDTHCVQGYVCDLCEDQYENQYYNVIACADRQLADFVNWVKEQPFGENTTIILCGDHLTMDAEYSGSVDPEFPRSLYQVIINPAAEPSESADPHGRIYSALDMFPTTLAALGVEIPGDRLGLGTNLFSEELTLSESLGTEELADQIKQTNKYYNRHFLYATPRTSKNQ